MFKKFSDNKIIAIAFPLFLLFLLILFSISIGVAHEKLGNY